MNEQTNHPETHYNEEPRNDFVDTGVGFAGMFAVCIGIFLILLLIDFLVN